MKKEGKNVVNYEFVDLGLSVQWANMNVGAEKVEDFGKYYSWDEVINSKNVDWEEDGRMPSEEEIDELIKKCDWEWKEESGVRGFKVTSKFNKSWIFLPAGGCKNVDGVHFEGIGGYYLSKTMNDGKLRGCIELVFSRIFKGKKLAGTQYKRLVRLVK
jgi:uncharacterized protein (TIGR02145 family)